LQFMPSPGFMLDACLYVWLIACVLMDMLELCFSAQDGRGLSSFYSISF
jgi:hypothetical protein